MQFILQVAATVIVSSIITTKWGKDISKTLSKWLDPEEGKKFQSPKIGSVVSNWDPQSLYNRLLDLGVSIP